MVYTLTNYRTDFKDYVGDSSLIDATCDKWLTKSYTRIWNLLRNSNARRELPIIITRQTPTYDTVNLTYFVTLPDTAVAWRFPNNQQISQLHVGTNRQIYVAKGKTLQTIEYMDAVTYPTANGVYLSDIVADVVILDAAYNFAEKVARDYELAGILKADRTERIQQLNQKYAQQFIYNEND